MTKTWLAVFLSCLVPCLPVLGENVPISEQLAKEEGYLQELEKRAEESMRLITQEEKPHSKLAAFSSEMTKQSQELKAVKNFELLSKAITEKKKELAENQRISSNLRSVAEGKLVESAKRLEQLKQRASTLQKRLEQMEQSADQWAAGYSQMRQIDEKEALEQLRQSIQLELKDIGSKKTTSINQPASSASTKQMPASRQELEVSNFSEKNSFYKSLKEASQMIASGSTLNGLKALINLNPASSAEQGMLMEEVGAAVSKLSVALKERKSKSQMFEIASTLDRASKLGSPDAMILLGLMCANGDGMTKDLNSAYELFKSAAASGHADALYYQGECLFLGKGVEQNCNEAVKCFERALQLDCWRAADQLGVIYRKGLTGAPPNYDVALRYFTTATDHNIPSATFNLGVMMINGEGVPKNPSYGAQLFKRAAAAGWQPAMEGYAKCLLYGIGIPRDSKEAAHWISRAKRKLN